MSAGHTPGPWNEWATPDDLDMSHEICANNRLPIAIIYNGEKAQANARLIAAAPCMASAGQSLLASLDPDTLNPEQFNAWSDLQAAIAKATGQ